MSFALSHPPVALRGGLLGTVVVAHLGMLAVLTAMKPSERPADEPPLLVDLLPAPVVEKKPAPVAPPTVRHTPPSKAAAQPPAPQIEANRSAVPAEAPTVATQNPAPAKADAAPSRPAPALETVVPARFDADYLRNPAPAYPLMSKRMREEGKVVLRVLVNPQGGAENIEIKASSGSARLDETAAKTVATWKFVPARRGETAVQSWVLVPITFKLET